MFPLHDSLKKIKIPFVVWGLILANSIVFLGELLWGNAFIERYAFIPSRLRFLEISSFTPLFSSLFFHGGWFHLFTNMWFLRIFGRNVENKMGTVKFFGFYILTGIAASLVQYIAAPSSSIPMIGASGAIAGVLGAYLVFFPHATITSIVPLFFYVTILDIPAMFYLPYWFLLQLLNGVGQVASGTLAVSGGVAFLAHIGGFMAGYILAKKS